MSVDGAGTKYCSTECKAAGYHPYRRTQHRCAWCGKEAPHSRRPGSVWPYICDNCTAPIKHVVDRLKSHRVPHERARQLLTEPGCEICGVDLLKRVRSSGHGKNTARLVVDHDHDCCPASTHSCGQCVRGLICHSCNIAAGLVRDDPKIAQALASYLDRSRESAA
ncbi:hypothetical protein E1211_15265 [Micromonospora sp. 15K316]|nr:hypothetical protein E1211_15265 [Micromonospora sp. 15K316]